MNAGGVTKACKSNGLVLALDSGKRVSNTLVTYLHLGHNSKKFELIADSLVLRKWNQ